MAVSLTTVSSKPAKVSNWGNNINGWLTISYAMFPNSSARANKTSSSSFFIS